jgi:hypothetical protein
LTPGSGIRIRDPGGEKSGSGINIQYHISESLDAAIFRLKILKFFVADPDPGYGIIFTLDFGSGMKKFGSGIRDPV